MNTYAVTLAMMALLATLSGCKPAEPPPVDESKMSAEEIKLTAECKAKGGFVASGPGGGTGLCVLRTRDGGKPCHSSSQCEAGCRAPGYGVGAADPTATAGLPTGVDQLKGRCAISNAPWGCYSRVENNEVMPGWCFD